MRCPTLRELPAAPAGKVGWPWTVETTPSPSRLPGGVDWPKFSVTVPSFEQAGFLEETIRSVLLQGYPDIELTVMDGGSRDRSVAVIRKYEPWLAGWVSERDRGQSHAINKGWALATGEWLAFLNSDDFYLPAALRKVALAWGGDPSVAVVAGGMVVADANSNPRAEHGAFLRADSPLDLSVLPPSDWFMPQQAAFFARTHLDAVGRWLREGLHYTMDRELMYRLCRQGRVLIVNELLAADRHHAQNKRTRQTLRMYREDAVALACCTWGTARDQRQRRRVARWRRAQGHCQYAVRIPDRLPALWHYSLAALYRPDYLRRRSFARSVLRHCLPRRASRPAVQPA